MVISNNKRPNDPGKLSGLFIAAHEKHRYSMEKNHNDHETASYHMHLPEKPAIRDRAHDILNTSEGHF